MAESTFDHYRNTIQRAHDEYRRFYNVSKNTWAIGAPYGGGTSYAVILQKTPDEKRPMIRAGCHYFTLKQAKRHWGIKAHRGHMVGKAILLHIATLVAIAQANGLLDKRVKFDPTMPMPKKAPKPRARVKATRKTARKKARR